MKGILLAIQFLTIIPLRLKGEVTERDIGRSVSFFVIGGMIHGMIILMVYHLSSKIFHTDITIATTLLTHIIINGGFHLDGLADTFDAIAMKSTGNRQLDIEKRLAIMKSGSIGPTGAIAIIATLALKYLFLKDISGQSILYSSILFLPVISRWCMVVSIYKAQHAKKDGLGYLIIKNTKEKEVVISTIIMIALFTLLSILFSDYMYNIFFYISLIGINLILSKILRSIFTRRFNGITGDNLGAINEISEIIFLMEVIIWQRFFI